MREEELYSFTPGHAICTEAQTAPPIGLVNKYDTAKRILNERNSSIDGEKILKNIHLLADSEVVSPTVENITKSYITDITTYYDVKPEIEKALELFLEAKVLLLSNNNYKITSDLEGKLLEEMKEFNVELFNKKRSLINYIKDHKLFLSVAAYNDGANSFKFSIVSDQDDELASSGSKQLKLKVYSLFNVDENRQDFIDNLKMETQHQKDLITLVPDNKEFLKIDRLIGEVSRYSFMEEKYSNETDQNKRQIIREFSNIREEKEKELRVEIEKAYHNATLIYMFDDYLLTGESFQVTIKELQRKLIKNIYTKRLAAELSESLIPSIFSRRKDSLSSLFSGDDFLFFDSHGNFTGDNLKVVEEIIAKIKSRYVDGHTLEAELSGAPWGYSFGTIVSTLAVLFRAGRLFVKYNGNTWSSYKDNGIQEAFTNATKFKSASFKAIIGGLTPAQKNKAVQLLLDLESETHTGCKMDWNINDFDLADSIRQMADHFINALSTLGDTVEDFETLFPAVANQKQILLNFSGKTTESNYIEKVEYLLANSDQFSGAIQTILDAQKFIKKNFSKVREWKRFIEEVAKELKKAERADGTITDAQTEFTRLYKQDMVKNYGSLEQQAQIVKDSYFKLLKNAAERMSHEYQVFRGKVDAAIKTLQGYPAELNVDNQKKLDELKLYSTNRIIKEPWLEFSISCKNCGYSLSDILNYSALVPIKESELLNLQNSFIKKEKDSSQGDSPRKVTLKINSKFMKVKEYKELLEVQRKSLADASPDEEIELDIEIQ